MGLLGFISYRALIVIPMLFILLSSIFIILNVIPGDPAEAILGTKAPPEAIEHMRHLLGLDKPLHVRYFEYFGSIIKGDLGTSMSTGLPVIEEIKAVIPTTIELCIAGSIMATLIGILNGIVTAIKNEKFTGYFTKGITLFGYSMPYFWLGIILQLLFAVYLGVLPSSGRVDLWAEPTRITGLVVLDSLLTGRIDSLVNGVKHLILPALTIGMIDAAPIARVCTVNILQVLGEDYILIAKAKGVPRNAIFYRHALRNAILPTVAVIGMQFALLMGGSVLVESVFTLPGLGRRLVLAATLRDLPTIQGIMAIYAVIIVSINTIADVLFYFLDPRVRY